MFMVLLMTRYVYPVLKDQNYKKTGILLTTTLVFYIFENQLSKYHYDMKTMLSGIMALIIPVFVVAQTSKDAPDLSQIQKKINKIENENTKLKNQLNSVQKTLNQMTQAEIKEHSDLAKHESLARANQDTVRMYSGRIQKLEEGNAEIEHALMLRTIGFLVVFILLIILLVFVGLTHMGKQRKSLEELLEKMKAQREEREKRINDLKTILEQAMKAQREEREKRIDELKTILEQAMKAQREEREQRVAELRADLAQSKNEISALKKETGERLAAMNDNIAHADKNLQTILAAKVAELGQKVADSGKKLDDQIIAAHKKTDELKTALAREIEAIRSKFE